MAQIRVFRGKSRGLTLLIFEALEAESPLNPYKIWKLVDVLCRKRGLKAPYLHMVARRIRYLADEGYLKLISIERKESGQEVRFYELSAKVRLAKWINETDLNRFIGSLNEAEATSILSVIKKGGAPRAHN